MRLDESTKRITLSEAELTSVISVWIGRFPKEAVEKFIEHHVLKHYKRQGAEPKVNTAIAALIARELTAKGWEVSYPEPKSQAGRG